MSVIAELGRRGVVATGLAIDSRQVRPGDVFLAYPGTHADGRDFIDQAVARGAVAVLAEQGVKSSTGRDAVLLEIEGLAHLAGYVAHLVYGRPSEKLWLTAVTGTNGKTSVSQWIAQALTDLNHPCAVIGTLGNGFPDALEAGINTTPDAITLHRELARYLAAGADSCVMEVSSIGLDQGRVNGAAFDVAVFTNLTRDHLDYHGSMEAYAGAKARLFETDGLAAAVINLDDAFGRQLAAGLAGKLRVVGYTLADKGGTLPRVDHLLQPGRFEISASGIGFQLGDIAFEAPVVGRFNAANLLAVIGALLERGIPLADCATALRNIAPPPGRMQAVGGRNQPLVVVDYAHTPDALEKALECLRETADARHGKLICVFGCGGDRDPGKRPQMGAVAERHADCVMLTSDNPRSENPEAILDAIASGMKAPCDRNSDRPAAIFSAIAGAALHDVILIAGKGHEPYQEIEGIRHPFSDLLCAQAALADRAGGTD